jgi:hypothetical protein
LWAYLERRGEGIDHPHALGADAILAAQALHAGKPGDRIIVATTNLRHLSRFPGIEARLWQAIS